MVRGNIDIPLSKISLSATKRSAFSQFGGALILFDSLMGVLCLVYISWLWKLDLILQTRTSF